MELTARELSFLLEALDLRFIKPQETLHYTTMI